MWQTGPVFYQKRKMLPATVLAGVQVFLTHGYATGIGTALAICSSVWVVALQYSSHLGLHGLSVNLARRLRTQLTVTSAFDRSFRQKIIHEFFKHGSDESIKLYNRMRKAAAAQPKIMFDTHRLCESFSSCRVSPPERFLLVALSTGL